MKTVCKAAKIGWFYPRNTHVEFATKYGIGSTYWGDAEAFGIYDRISGDWGAEKDILLAPNLP